MACHWESEYGNDIPTGRMNDLTLESVQKLGTSDFVGTFARG